MICLYLTNSPSLLPVHFALTKPCEQGIFYCCLGSIRWLSPLWPVWLMLLCEVRTPPILLPPSISSVSSYAYFKIPWGEAINAVLCDNMRSFSWGVACCSSRCLSACMFSSRHNLLDWHVLVLRWCQFASSVNFSNQMETGKHLSGSFRALSLWGVRWDWLCT